MTRSEAWAMFAAHVLGTLTGAELDPDTRHRLTMAHGLETVEGYDGETVATILAEVRANTVEACAVWADDMIKEFDRRCADGAFTGQIVEKGPNA